MIQKINLKLSLAFLLLLALGLLAYRAYIYLAYTDYEAINAQQVSAIEVALRNRHDFNFAVVGSINNSLQIFDKWVAPELINNRVDFIVSVGDAVYDGAEAKYQLLYKGLSRVKIPFLLSVGDNEVEGFGAQNYYRYFGPFLYSFHLADSYFIMLDGTGNTPVAWQQRWLNEELARAQTFHNRFVFMNYSPLFALEQDEQGDPRVDSLMAQFSAAQVSAVFSLGEELYSQQEQNGVSYINVGQTGGLMLEKQHKYQFTLVKVQRETIDFVPVVIEGTFGNLRYKLETLKLFLYSFIYMSLFNLLVIITALGLVALRVYSKIIKQDSYYRDFSFSDEHADDHRLKIAMFTNNYLPFIGGVPISIDRLRRGLTQLNHRVTVFAPTYSVPLVNEPDAQVVRIPSIGVSRKMKFPFANLWSPGIRQQFAAQAFDVVHVHHPYFLGTKGLNLASRRKIPVVFTYHTRMERYVHYLPLPGEQLKTLMVHFLIRRFANRCQAVITPSISTEEYLRNLGVSAIIETIPTGINLTAYEGHSAAGVAALRVYYAQPDERLLISVSRLAKEKNLDFLIDGIHKVKQHSGVPFKLLLVGDGPERHHLEQKVIAAGLQQQVVFAGSMAPAEVVEAYLAADIFVFASTSETQGMVLLEAMAGGCPVVAVRASGVHDLIEQGYNGVKVAESTDSWAEAVIRLLEDDDLRTTMAVNGRTFAEKYSVANMALAIERLYRRVVGRAQLVAQQSADHDAGSIGRRV
ncbi:glycosyltransferase [Reinekea sp.]|uniref:glycosyltransferase n=1 Tax=Reinekea sp. TaxID=1970455 RepID=UPI002A833103|nr:glycosyltransferase [Reinekea sp.]